MNDLTKRPGGDIANRHGRYEEGFQFLRVRGSDEEYERGGEIDVFSDEGPEGETIRLVGATKFDIGEDSVKHLNLYGHEDLVSSSGNRTVYQSLAVDQYVVMHIDDSDRVFLEIRARKNKVISKRMLLGLGMRLSGVRNFDGTI